MPICGKKKTGGSKFNLVRCEQEKPCTAAELNFQSEMAMKYAPAPPPPSFHKSAGEDEKKSVEMKGWKSYQGILSLGALSH